MHGRAEILVRELAGRARSRAATTRRSCRLPFTRIIRRTSCSRGAEAWRLLDVTSVRRRRDVDLVIADEVPDLLRAASAKGRCGWCTSTAPRTNCAAPGSATSRIRARDVALRRRLDRDRHPDAARVRRSLHDRQDGVRSAAEIQRASNPRRATIRRSSRSRLHAAARMATTCSTVTRLKHVKRVDLAIDALRESGVTGASRDRRGRLRASRALSEHIERRGLRDRRDAARPRGRRPADRAVLPNAAPCCFAPHRKTTDTVTLESFLVAQTGDHRARFGRHAEFVTDGVNGYVCDPTPRRAVRRGRIASRQTRRCAASSVDRGYEVAQDISWDHVVERLVGAAQAAERVGASA